MSNTLTNKPPYYQINEYGSAKAYTALINQTGTNNPLATILQNSFEHEIAWTRTDIGVFQGAIPGGFKANKTWVQITIGGNPPTLMATHIMPDNIIFVTGWEGDGIVPTDGIDNASIRIVVFD